MNYSPSLIPDLLRRLESERPAAARLQHELPVCRFTADDASDRDLLVTRSRPQNFYLGTGASIFTECLIPAIVSARFEVILVTCFWAPSKTLTALHNALAELAAHRRALIQKKGSAAVPPLRVRICFSSRSLLQKLLHPQSRHGYAYHPSSWAKKLGLPEPALLEAGGIELHMKSIFFLPFSVMHPKFVIIDRQHAFLPSCNVSWEAWFEGCIEITGDAVRSLLSFYSRTWGDIAPNPSQAAGVPGGNYTGLDARVAGLALNTSNAGCRVEFQGEGALPTLVLPSSHHRNPRFRPFPWQDSPRPPNTPLNLAMAELFSQARQFIYIQTPDLTCEAVIVAILDALARGVDVTIVTNQNIKPMEQLLTAGTTTSRCIQSLIRRFHGFKEPRRARHDLEAGRSRTETGRLQISYFQPKSEFITRSRISTPSQTEEPVHSHLKLTLVDGTYAVLGSGNMDRASWFTSQELSLLFYDRDFCVKIKSGLDAVLADGRLDPVFDSAEEVRRGR